jgi:hypothetical protein
MPEATEDGFARGISFDDFTRMSTMERVVGHKHRREIPLWTLNDTATRRVVLHYMECRVFPQRNQRMQQIAGTERERFKGVIAAMKESAKRLDAIVGRLCSEYVAHIECGSPFCAARRKVLAALIESIDKQLMLSTRPDIFHSIVTAYYRQRMNATEVAQFLGGITPQGVRQTIFRLNRAAAALGYKVEFLPKLTAAERAARKLDREANRRECIALLEEARVL